MLKDQVSYINETPARTTRNATEEKHQNCHFCRRDIVFGTFVVKEGWREHVKSLEETIEAAQNIYTLRADGLTMTSQLNGLGSEIEAIRAKISSTELGFTALGVNRTMLLASWQLQQLETSVNNLKALLNKLPGEKARATELEDVAKKLQELHKLHRSIGEMTARAAAKLTPDGLYPPDEANGISAQIFRFSTSILDMYRQVDDLTKKSLADAEADRDRQEKLYSIATWVSYGLYALGWTFGLIGRLYGIDAIGTEG